MTRESAGRRSQAKGDALERQLDAYHAQLAAEGRGHIRRVGTPVRVMGPVRHDARGRHGFPATFDGPQGVDFVGFHVLGGLPCPTAIEAKTHDGDGAWDCGINPDGTVATGGALTAHQWAELCAYEAACSVGSMVILAAWGRVWLLRPNVIADHVKRAGRRTIRPTEIEGIADELRGVRWLG